MKKTMHKRFHNILFLTAAVIIVGTVLPLQAANVFYFYDDIGRLSRAVTNTGDAAVYSYDEVGNLLSVGRETTNPLPPVITSIFPDIAFTGTSVSVTITGSNLLSTQDISTDTPGVRISKATVTNIMIIATLDVLKDAAPGIITIKVTTAFGTSTIPITVDKLTLTPTIKTMQPGSTADFQLSLSSNAPHDINISLASDDSTVIGVPATVVISSGSSAASFTATALTEGTTVLRAADSAGLASVYVTQPFAGPATSISPEFSVLLQTAQTPTAKNEGPYLSNPISILLPEPPSQTILNKGPCLSSSISVIVEQQPANTTINSGPFLSTPVSVKLEGQTDSTAIDYGPVLSLPVSVQN